jgi:hypothetical protein
MTDKGYISIHREIQEHWIWEGKFDEGRAWIDLLLRASFSEHEYKGEVQKVGTFTTSQLQLSKDWKWSRHKVCLFLNKLQKNFMLLKKADNKKTTLTIVNYSLWQGVKNKGDNNGTSKGHQKDTNNKENKENKKDYAENVAMTEENYTKLIELYGATNVDKIISNISEWKYNGKGYKKSKTENDYARAQKWLKKDFTVSTASSFRPAEVQELKKNLKKGG